MFATSLDGLRGCLSSAEGEERVGESILPSSNDNDMGASLLMGSDSFFMIAAFSSAAKSYAPSTRVELDPNMIY